MNVKEARSLFSGLENQVFLDAACVSLAPKTAKEAIMRFMEMALACPARDASFHHIAMDTWRACAYDEAAKLFNAHMQQIALIESTSHGLNIAANAIPFRDGDEVIIGNTEFLQVAIPFQKKAEQKKLSICPVDLANPDRPILDTILQAVTAKTKAICISSVQWCSGHRMPMKALGEFCKQKGIWLIVDAVHEAGMLNIDTSERYADFLIAGGHKWLNAPYGCGIMILSPRALELEPNGFGYLSLQEPAGGWGGYFQDPKQTPFREYPFLNQARKFEIGGTSNYPGAIGLTESLRIVNAIGMNNVEEHILSLAETLRHALRELGVKIISPDNVDARSGITVFSAFTDPREDLALLEKLLDERILVSIRYTSGVGGIRVSTHYFNNESDVQALVGGLKKLVRK